MGGEDPKKNSSSAPTASPGGMRPPYASIRALAAGAAGGEVAEAGHIEAFKRSFERRGGVFDGACAVSRRASGCTTRRMTDARPGERVVTGRARGHVRWVRGYARPCIPRARRMHADVRVMHGVVRGIHGVVRALRRLCAGDVRHRAGSTRWARVIARVLHGHGRPDLEMNTAAHGTMWLMFERDTP